MVNLDAKDLNDVPNQAKVSVGDGIEIRGKDAEYFSREGRGEDDNTTDIVASKILDSMEEKVPKVVKDICELEEANLERNHDLLLRAKEDGVEGYSDEAPLFVTNTNRQGSTGVMTVQNKETTVIMHSSKVNVLEVGNSKDATFNSINAEDEDKSEVMNVHPSETSVREDSVNVADDKIEAMTVQPSETSVGEDSLNLVEDKIEAMNVQPSETSVGEESVIVAEGKTEVRNVQPIERSVGEESVIVAEDKTQVMNVQPIETNVGEESVIVAEDKTQVMNVQPIETSVGEESVIVAEGKTEMMNVRPSETSVGEKSVNVAEMGGLVPSETGEGYFMIPSKFLRDRESTLAENDHASVAAAPENLEDIKFSLSENDLTSVVVEPENLEEDEVSTITEYEDTSTVAGDSLEKDDATVGLDPLQNGDHLQMQHSIARIESQFVQILPSAENETAGGCQEVENSMAPSSLDTPGLSNAADSKKAHSLIVKSQKKQASVVQSIDLQKNSTKAAALWSGTEQRSPARSAKISQSVNSSLNALFPDQSKQDDVQNKVKAQTEEIQSLRRQLEEKDTEMSKMYKSTAKMNRENQKQKAELDLMKSDKRKMRQEIQMLRTQLEQAKQESAKLSNILSISEQKHAMEKNRGGSYLDDSKAATPALLVSAHNGVKDASSNFAKVFKLHIDSLANRTSIENHLKNDVGGVSRPGHAKFVYQAYVCNRLFPLLFNVQDIRKRNDGLPNDKLEQMEQSFRQYQMHDLKKFDTVGRLLQYDPQIDLDLREFCIKGFAEVITGSIPKYDIKADIYQHILEEKHLQDSKLYTSYCKVAVSIWLLYSLTNSFWEPPQMLDVCRGDPFDSTNMQSVVPLDDSDSSPDEQALRLKVGFSVIPGFQVGNGILQSDVYVISD